MSFEIISKIKSIREYQKDFLDLSCLSLTEVPEEVRELTWLKRINLSFNLLENLPEWFQDFTLLENLDLRGNKLSSLFPGLRKLVNLQSLNIRNNNLNEIPHELRELNNLIFISLGSNKIEEVPEWFFSFSHVNIEDNPIIDPPIEIYTRGYQAISNYFRERSNGTENLYEAKLLIVGEAGAGKTTLMNKIVDENYVLNPFEASTKGIEIKPFYFYTGDKNYFRINIWDFGGQEIYHATHQFFLTKRSLYLLLADNRAENTDFNYWLQTIELLSGNSPLLIVQNEKQDRKKDINEFGMKERFKNIKTNISFNLASNKSKLRSLVREIQHQIVNLPHIGTELPKIWIEIRKELEKRSLTTSYITEQEYLDICSLFGMQEKERAFFLSDYLHDLGVFLHFRDNAVLKRWIILKPDWGTEAVYKILDNEKVINSNGYFTKTDLKEIWHHSLYSDMHDELISLMMKFELCYQLEGNDTFIAPQLLKTTKSRYTWSDNDNLVVRYDYEFMPKGIITRFIVRMHYYIKDQELVWREGVVLEREQTWGEVTETYGKREIRIKIRGKNRKEFLAIILDSLDKIHLSYTNLKVSKLIPCNCSKCIAGANPYYFHYDSLKKYFMNGIYEERCKESLSPVKIATLVDDAFGKSSDESANAINVFISYSEDDKIFKNEFIKYLKPLEKESRLRFTDKSNVTAGENEKNYIRDKIDTADIIVLLISQDYLISEWNYNIELTKSLDRNETNSCAVIPVIMRDCSWSETPLSNFKPVLFNNKPIFATKDRIEESLTHAAYQVRNAINTYITNRREITEEDYRISEKTND